MKIATQPRSNSLHGFSDETKDVINEKRPNEFGSMTARAQNVLNAAQFCAHFRIFKGW